MIKILVDSASDLEQQDASELGVTVLPLQIRFGSEEYLDGVSLTHREFFEKLIETDELPQTSQINEYRFDEVFASLTADGSEVIAITLSSKLSGTHASAVKAAKKYAGKVIVVDSLNACIGERILLEYAVRLVGEGKLTAAQIAAELEEKKGKIQLLAVLDTLKYLRKGGRISSVTAIAGEMLSIKPVIAVVRGEVKLVGKAMGSKKGNNLLTQLVRDCGGIDFTMPYVLGDSGLSDAFLQKYIHDSELLWKGYTDHVPYHMIGSTIGTHVGPGAIAVAFFAK
ncbi:MAG TPA: DegV family protein [Candidatus Gallimonas intestinigallinarum]|uniref:DegV family protein n=1 Tax=Candidatus Gallimonas intestinigallinarum TaxID=2838604 RepID=A0A9D2DWH0_9FIRM|nr:DegV family protein [Candidatus Gallimonas intestinigallinarum]